MYKLFSQIIIRHKMKTYAVILLFIVAGITKFHAGSWNDQSRMALVQSIVEHRTLVIDKSDFISTGDKVFINGHFYSDKPPMLSIITSIIYLPLYKAGIKLGMNYNMAYYLLNLFTMGACYFLCLFAFYNSLKFTGIKEQHIRILTATLAFGTFMLPWSTTFNNHLFSASMLFLGFYFLFIIKHKGNNRLNLFLSGLFYSLSGSTDIPASIFYVSFLVYIFTDKNLKRDFLFFIIPLIFTALPTLLINYKISGSFKPIELNISYYLYPGSPWYAEKDLFSGVNINKGVFLLTYIFNCLIGTYGLFSYNPILLIPAYLIIKEIKSKNKYWKEALCTASASFILITYYLLTTNNYSGYSYGIRWFTAIIPLLMFFTYSFFENLTTTKRRLYTILFLISIMFSIIGIIDPWSKWTIHPVPAIANILELGQKKIKVIEILESLKTLTGKY